MAETPEEAIAAMRRASEVVSSVLPPALAELVYDELLTNIAAVLHGSAPQLQWVAGEVLALAEQQQARGDVYVYRNTESLLTPTTKEVAPGVCVDGNDDGLVGVEVLDAVLVEIDGHPVIDGRVAATVLPPPPMVDAVPAGRIPVELAVPEPSGDVVAAVAREICNVGRDYDLWASGEVGESTREDLRAEARAAIVAMQQPGGLNPAVQDVRLTPEELAALEARFTAQRGRSTLIGVSKQMVTRAQVRDAAHALFLWNNELAGDPRFTLHHVAGAVDREPYGALIGEVLYHLGIPVQEGEQP